VGAIATSAVNTMSTIPRARKLPGNQRGFPVKTDITPVSSTGAGGGVIGGGD
jgi:hypothetical protein